MSEAKRGRPYIDLTGQRFGRLVAIERRDNQWLCHCDCGETNLVHRSNLVSGRAKSCGCLRRERMSNLKESGTPLDRFMRMVVPEPNSGCWLYEGSGAAGYGAFWDGEKRIMAHRFSYEAFVGPIPDGLTIDHKCFVRCCVNPDHLEPVTLLENIRRYHAKVKDDPHFEIGRLPLAKANKTKVVQPRQIALRLPKTHCPQGHPYTPENSRYGKHGARYCRECSRQRSRENAKQLRERTQARRERNLGGHSPEKEAAALLLRRNLQAQMEYNSQ